LKIRKNKPATLLAHFLTIFVVPFGNINNLKIYKYPEVVVEKRS